MEKATKLHLELRSRQLSLRNLEENDLPFLLKTYVETRSSEMERVPDWTPEMKRAFLEGQFEAQHIYYQNNYKGAFFWIIEWEGQKIGRLYVHPFFQNHGMRIIDISIIPEFRNQGIGGELFKDLQKWAAELSVPLSIHVESFNPAKKLYERLGFKKISETNGVYHLMEWRATISA